MRQALVWAVCAGIAAGVVAIARPGDRDLVLDAYLLFVGALALLILVRVTSVALPRTGRSLFADALREVPVATARPAELETLERRLLLATETAFEVHYRLRPLLREIAAHRLASHRGIDLDGDPDAARDALGPEAWELVRPDREPPAERLGPGHPLSRIRAAIEALERV